MVSWTKNASPADPSFIISSVSCSFTFIVTYPDVIIDSLTYLSLGLRTLSLPNLTWKGVLTRDPSGYLTTMMSMHPLSVAYCVRKG